VFASALRSNVRGAENTALFYCCLIAVFTEELPMNSPSKSVTTTTIIIIIIIVIIIIIGETALFGT
jgi:hypothetical protein